MIKRIVVRKKEQKKVYGILLETRDTTFLSIQYANSLEEAFSLAKLEFDKQNPALPGIGGGMLGAKIVLFAIKTTQELTASPTLLERAMEEERLVKEALEKEKNAFVNAMIDPTTRHEAEPPKLVLKRKKEKKEPVDKNELMKKIIKNRDTEAFLRHFESFTPAERKYIEEHLK